MLPDLNRLKVFYHVHAAQSVVHAAEILNITPSAVSQALNKLEAELTVQLFTRLHKRLVPTRAGKELFEIVSPFIRELDLGVKNILKARQVPSGSLRIGTPVEFGNSIFPGIVARFRKLYPEVVFSLKLGPSDRFFPRLDSGELDFALVDIYLTRDRRLEGLDRYAMEPLVDEQLLLACSRSYYEAHVKGDHSLENLEGLAFISYEKSALSLRAWFKHHFGKYPRELNRVLTVNSHQAVISGIREELGLGVISAPHMAREITKGKIVPILTQKTGAMNQIALVQLQDKVPTLTERTFIQYLKQDLTARKFYLTDE